MSLFFNRHTWIYTDSISNLSSQIVENRQSYQKKIINNLSKNIICDKHANDHKKNYFGPRSSRETIALSDQPPPPLPGARGFSCRIIMQDQLLDNFFFIEFKYRKLRIVEAQI